MSRKHKFFILTIFLTFLSCFLFIGTGLADRGKLGHTRTLRTGGTNAALDGISGSDLVVGDFAFVLEGGVLRTYLYKDYGAPQTESDPQLIVPDSLPGDNGWQLQEQPAYTSITTDTTIYLATTGNDTTGDGTVTTPWYSLGKAFDYLADKYILPSATVTISIAAGTYTGYDPVIVDHPCSRNIMITGQGSSSTSLTFLVDGITCNNGPVNITGVKLIGSSATSYTAFVANNCNATLSDIAVSTFSIGVHAEYSNVSMVGGSGSPVIFNCTKGIWGDKSSYIYNEVSVDNEELAASVGVSASGSTTIDLSTTMGISSFTSYGITVGTNSYVDASGVSFSKTSGEDMNLTATTSYDASPTFENGGSWIFKP